MSPDRRFRRARGGRRHPCRRRTRRAARDRRLRSPPGPRRGSRAPGHPHDQVVQLGQRLGRRVAHERLELLPLALPVVPIEPGSTTTELSPGSRPLKPPTTGIDSRAREGALDRLRRPRARACMEAAAKLSSGRAARRAGESRDREPRGVPPRPSRGRRGAARPRPLEADLVVVGPRRRSCRAWPTSCATRASGSSGLAARRRRSRDRRRSRRT